MYTVYTLDRDTIPDVDLRTRRAAIRYMRQYAPRGRLQRKRGERELRMMPPPDEPVHPDERGLPVAIALYFPDRVVPKLLAWSMRKVDRLTRADIPERYQGDPTSTLAIQAITTFALTDVWHRSPWGDRYGLPPACAIAILTPALRNLATDELWANYLASHSAE